MQKLLAIASCTFLKKDTRISSFQRRSYLSRLGKGKGGTIFNPGHKAGGFWTGI